MSQNSLVEQTKPVLYEGFIVVILGLIIIYNITATDISFHGSYVGFLIKYCHEKNVEKMCVEFREHLKVAPNTQMELGDAYWKELARQALFIGITMFLIRISISWLLHKAHVQKMRTSSWLMAILYGTVGYGLFVFGILDTLYYILQGQMIPTDLEWLNHAGVFEFSKAWHGDTAIVDSIDLYLTNIAGVFLISTVLILTMVSFKEAKVHRGIA